MKWYFASRTRHTEKLKEIARFLESKGETFSSDWIYEGNLKPFIENLIPSQALADRCLVNILNSDIFIVFNDLDGTDLFTELGICLANNKLNEKKIKIYSVGKYDQASLMQLHAGVEHLETLKQVFDKEGINYGDFVFPEFD
ncbi:MAG: hypothetical protein WCO35_01700 [Candidatus Nomurabacteria bacterium]